MRLLGVKIALDVPEIVPSAQPARYEKMILST